MKRVLTAIIVFLVLTGVIMGRDALTGSQGKPKEMQAAEPARCPVAEGNNRFAFDMLKSLQEEDRENSIFFSPYSISTALSMLLNGASGEARKEMAVSLYYGGIDLDKLNERQLALKKSLEKGGEKVELSIANSIWAHLGVVPKESFQKALKEYYLSEFFTRDFSDKSVVGEINGWISDKTRGMIPAMLHDISPQSIMFLINAIYFKGIWAKEFDPELTREEAFTDYQNKKGKAQMMHQTLSVTFRETEEYKAVRLPYGEGEAAMYVILPREGLGLNEFLDTLTLDKWETIIGSMVTEKIELAIPKFKMSYGVKRLNDALMRVGMEKIFYSGSLMNIMDDPRLFVEYVDHKAVIEVDEKGTKAAAVTIISIGKSAYERPKKFIADRPFFFVIRDEKSGMILFMGKVLSL